MGKSYKPITSMKEVPEQLRKLRRQYLRYQQAEVIYSISHKCITRIPDMRRELIHSYYEEARVGKIS